MKKQLAVMALFAALVTPSLTFAQGCSLCRDATAGSAPQARKAFRLAIPLLGIPAVLIFGGSLVLARKIRPGRNVE